MQLDMRQIATSGASERIDRRTGGQASGKAGSEGGQGMDAARWR